MLNRLRKDRHMLPALFLSLWLLPSLLFSQQQFFTFQYPGPDTIVVSAACEGVLFGNINQPIVTSTAGFGIAQSYFDSTLSGFSIHEKFQGSETANLIWHVQDSMGNAAEFTFVVFFQDTTPPVFDPIAAGIDPVVTLASILQIPPPPNIPVLDNCTSSANIVVSFEQTTLPVQCMAGSFQRIWTATDAAGNSTTLVQTFQVLADNSQPVIISQPQSDTVACMNLQTAYQNWLTLQSANFQAVDPSGVTYSSNAPTTVQMGCSLAIPVVFRATDGCGWFSTANATFSSFDMQGPIVNTPPQDTIIACDVDGNYVMALNAWIDDHAGMDVSDACNGNITYQMQVNGVNKTASEVVDAFLASFSNGCGTQTVGGQIIDKVRGLVPVDFFVTDGCGNITFAGKATFAALDTLAPVLTAPNTIQLFQCDTTNQITLNDWLLNHGNATVTDDCSATTWTDFTWSTSDGQSGTGTYANPASFPQVAKGDCQWQTEVVFNVADACGNSATTTQIFALWDNIAPVFIGIVGIDTVYCPDTLPTVQPALVADNCDTSVQVTFDYDLVSTQCGGSFTLTGTWTATDDCGNISTASKTFVFLDTIAPTFIFFPQDITVACDSIPALPVSGVDFVAADVCGTLDTVLIAETNNQNPDPALCAHYNYQITRTFTAIDECGNTKTRIQTISVRDSVPPTFVGFVDTTVTCESIALLPTPTAVGNCGQTVTAPIKTSEVITAGICPDSYTLTLIWASEDVCGNRDSIVQTIHVEDKTGPVLVGVPANINVECNGVPAQPIIGTDILASDNCDESVDISFIEIEDRDPNTNSCAHWTFYGLRRIWTATDNCGNTAIATQYIQVQDNLAPVLVCQGDQDKPNDFGTCGANVVIPNLISVQDECTSTQMAVMLQDSIMFDTLAGVPANDAAVLEMTLTFVAPNVMPTEPVVGNAILMVYLENADAELSTEYFNILDENGELIGETMLAPTQCGNSQTQITVPAQTLNKWLTDGQTTIKLVPNASGADAVNSICPGGRVKAALEYTYSSPTLPVTLSYSVDGSAPAPFPATSAQFMEPGLHNVQYFATDCNGNEQTCALKINVLDIEGPSIVQPAAMTAFVGLADCESSPALPFPSMSDNCGFAEMYVVSTDVEALFFANDPNAQMVPQDVDFQFTMATPNAIGNGFVTIRVKGDNANAGEFFRILDENGQFLTTTSIAAPADECTAFHESTFWVSAAQLNNWATDGVVQFKAISNKDAGAFTDFIAPCGTLQPDGTDGVSEIQARLEFTFAKISYKIKDNSGQVIKSGFLNGDQTTANLGAGTYEVTYEVPDGSGNFGEVTFPLSVRDTIAPTPICVNATIFTNASGTVDYYLNPSEIDGGSFDNCSATNVSLSTSMTSFKCDMAGVNNIVTLTATDEYGNSASCQAVVKVETATFQPNFTPNICENGQLQLFANPPAGNGITLYTYQWSGPNGYLANEANPYVNSINAASAGSYAVTVTGITGCTAVGIAQVAYQSLPTTPVLTSNKINLCDGDDLVLHTEPFNGANVTYTWYKGFPNNGSLLGNTTVPDFIITQPIVGDHDFYVMVSGDGCTSLPSENLDITVYGKPASSVLAPAMDLCEGDALTLGTAVQGPNVGYAWTGPNAFASSAQFPQVITAATTANAGQYSLVIYENGCPSDPSMAVVNVKPKPAQPELVSSGAACVGESVNLICNALNAAEYVWVSPYFDTTITQLNGLMLSAVTTADSGAWRVYVVSQGCKSDFSVAQNVTVQSLPQVVAAANLPVCEGKPVQLGASSDNPNVSYAWSGPANFVSFNQSPIANDVAGTYTVIVTTPIGCKDTATVDVTISANPKIATLSYQTTFVNGVSGCVSGANDLVLQSLMTQPGSYVYQWSGPNGFVSAEQNPTLPNASALVNGTYNLMVESADGCQSLAKSITIDLRDRPNTPLLAVQDATICEGETILLTVPNANQYTGNTVSFDWTRPDGLTQTNSGALNVNSANSANQSGDYSVIVSEDGCPSLPSAPINVTVYPTPPVPALTGNSPVCNGNALLLQTTPVAGAQYVWTGPAGFSASVANPALSQANSNNSGNYYLRTIINGCSSPLSQAYNVVVNPTPATPFALNDGAVCLSDAAEVLKLSISPNSATNGATYTWYNINNGQPVSAPIPATEFQLTDFQGINEGQTGFYVVSTLNGCMSQNSAPTFVSFNAVPTNTAFAGNDFITCDQKPLTLAASQPSIGTGIWSAVGNPAITIVNPNVGNSMVSDIVAGNVYKFVWSLSNGACKNYSTDTIAITVNAFEYANAVPLIDTCFAKAVHLSAVPGQSAIGSWSQPASQQLLQVKIASATDPNTLVSNLEPGNTYFFFWTLADVGCGTSTDTVVVRSIGSTAFAGEDRQVCNPDACTILVAAPLPNYEKGQWTSVDQNIDIASPTNYQTTACGLLPGENVFAWVTNDGICGEKSRDTIVLNYELTPTAQNDTIIVAFGHKVGFDIRGNDILPSNYAITPQSDPTYGKLIVTGNGTFTYQPNINFMGTDVFVYEVCNLNCSDACDVATVTLKVQEPSGCDVPTVITPNDDNVNDVFYVPCLESDQFPDNEVTIFNEWGGEVFHAQPYTNNWDGRRNGEDLPAGTYFFVVKFNGNAGTKSGFIMIQR